LLQSVTYQIGDKRFTGFIADGSGGRKSPGILVAHEGGGFLTEHPKERAEMLGRLGFVAFALDLFGDPRPSLGRSQGNRAGTPIGSPDAAGASRCSS
jgi:dienelactone hydrolase